MAITPTCCREVQHTSFMSVALYHTSLCSPGNTASLSMSSTWRPSADQPQGHTWEDLSTSCDSAFNQQSQHRMLNLQGSLSPPPN